MSEDLDLMAAEYALGALSTPERRAVETRARVDKDLSAAIDLWERRLTPMNSAAGAEAPPADLFSRIEAAIDAADAAVGRSQELRLDAGEWVTLVPGIERKQLWSPHTFLLRFAPGSTLPAHPHGAFEHCMVVSGEMVMGGVGYRPGDYQGVPANVAHVPIKAPSGALVLVQYTD